MKLDANHPVRRFQDVFRKVTPDLALELDSLYADDVAFADPFHQFTGREPLLKYFTRLQRRMTWAEFDFEAPFGEKGVAALPWTMRVKSKTFPKVVSIEGISQLRFNDRITYHRDYFDITSVVPDQVPVVGAVTRTLKRMV